MAVEVVSSNLVKVIDTYNKPETIKSALRDVDRIFLLTHWQSDLNTLLNRL